MLIRFSPEQVTIFLWSLFIIILINILIGVIKGERK